MIPDEELHEARLDRGPERSYIENYERPFLFTGLCTPATPPPAEPAEGDFSGGERCTAGDAWPCCEPMRVWIESFHDEGSEFMKHEWWRSDDLPQPSFCLWCGGSLPESASS